MPQAVHRGRRAAFLLEEGNVNRRGFLKRMGAGAAAVSIAPLALPTTAPARSVVDLAPAAAARGGPVVGPALALCNSTSTMEPLAPSLYGESTATAVRWVRCADGTWTPYWV